MKRCPTCNRVESDEGLKFCRVDGTTLVSETPGLGDEAALLTKSGIPHMLNADTRPGRYETRSKIEVI